jgi:hypothetical protein
MEKLVNNQAQSWIKEAQKRRARGEPAEIPFGSSALSVKLPSDDELGDIEFRGFNPDTVQSFIDGLQECRTGNPSDIRVAYMLRGAFNELIERVNQAETRA